jgi:predicted HTH domain antitoxin
MSNIVIEIPDELLIDAKIPKHKARDLLKKELAAHLYEQRILSFGNARRLAGMSKIDFHIFLSDKGIERGYDVNAYEEDKENIKKWLKK